MRTDPSGSGMLTLKASLARVLFFLEPATPMRASTSAFRSFKIPTQSTLERTRDSVLGSFNLESNHPSKQGSPSRQSHVIAGFQRDLDNRGAVYVHLFAGGGVASGHPAGLVEAVRLHSACVVCHENLEHNRLVDALQLQEVINTGE